MDSFRLRQIPEMGLAATLIALSTGPLADLTGSPMAAIQVASGLALAFTVGHVIVLVVRIREQRIEQPTVGLSIASVLDIALLVVGAVSLGTGAPVAYEWLLIFLLARPMLAFALVLGDVAASP